MPVAVFVSIAFVLSLIPLILIARYDHPSADDFTYGLLTSQAWASTGSILNVLSAAFKTVHDTYFNWQGSFSGVFMMAVQPAVFGENLYILTPLLTLSIFLFGALFLGKVILMDYLKADKWSFLVIGFVTAAMSLNFLPSPVEGIYWYNGAFYYTGFYALSLVVFGLVLRYYRAKSRKAMVIKAVLMILFSFAIGGGNYTTALVTALVLTLLTVLGLLHHQGMRVIFPAAAMLSNVAALVISLAAPGNAVRKSHFTHTPSVMDAIFDSLKTAWIYISYWTTLPVIVCLLFLIPLIYQIVRAVRFSFHFPLLILLISFGVFSSQFTPPIYALGYSGPSRLLNVIYFSYYIFMLVNMFYFTGWFIRQFRRKETKAAEQAPNLKLSSLKEKYRILLLVCFTVLFSAGCMGWNRVRTMTSVSAAISLKNGQAAKYDREANQRLKIYRSSRQKNVVVSKFSEKPYVLCFNDIEKDPSNWRNTAITKYYNLKSVVRKS